MVNMLVSSFDHSRSLVSSWKILNRKPWRKSHHTCSKPYLLFLLLLHDTQAKKPCIIVEIGGLGIITIFVLYKVCDIIYKFYD